MLQFPIFASFWQKMFKKGQDGNPDIPLRFTKFASFREDSFAFVVKRLVAIQIIRDIEGGEVRHSVTLYLHFETLFFVLFEMKRLG